MSNNVFLDVDDTILTRNLRLPGQENEVEMMRQLNEAKPSYIVIHPAPGACIKTKTVDGEKIFLNVCVSDKIPPPEDISDAKLFELLSEEAPAFTIPMSIGNERLEADKGGAPCTTYDIAINTAYFEKCQKKKSFWLFTISVIMDGVSNKFNKTLNTEEYVVLKNRKVMGKLQQHRIENREPRKPTQMPQKKLIEEISSDVQIKAEQSVPDKSDYLILREPSEGTAKRLIGLFQVPKGITSEDLTVLLDPDRIVVSAEKTSLSYDVSIPYTIKPEISKGFLDKDLRTLRLDMPVEQIEKER